MTAAVHKSREYWTPQRRLAAGEAPSRRPGRLPGGHVADLADLLKSIVLCPDCVGKFAAAKAGYVIPKNLPIARGTCDGCNGYTPQGTVLVHHTLADLR
jgi:hypothetical protein